MSFLCTARDAKRLTLLSTSVGASCSSSGLISSWHQQPALSGIVRKGLLQQYAIMLTRLAAYKGAFVPQSDAVMYALTFCQVERNLALDHLGSVHYKELCADFPLPLHWFQAVALGDARDAEAMALGFTATALGSLAGCVFLQRAVRGLATPIVNQWLQKNKLRWQ